MRALLLVLVLAGCDNRPIPAERPPGHPYGGQAAAPDAGDEPAFTNPPAVDECPTSSTLTASTPCGPASPCATGCVVTHANGAVGESYGCTHGGIICVLNCDECR